MIIIDIPATKTATIIFKIEITYVSNLAHPCLSVKNALAYCAGAASTTRERFLTLDDRKPSGQRSGIFRRTNFSGRGTGQRRRTTPSRRTSRPQPSTSRDTRPWSWSQSYKTLFGLHHWLVGQLPVKCCPWWPFTAWGLDLNTTTKGGHIRNNDCYEYGNTLKKQLSVTRVCSTNWPL